VHAFIAYAYPLIDTWLKAGYAVVSTDYEGLGTPGVHPLLVGSSEARSTLDSIRAARQFDPHLSGNVVITGHSQGGQAALFTAAAAPTWTPELHIKGTVSFSPLSHIVALIESYVASPSPLSSALLGMGIAGLSATDPSEFSPATDLTAAAQAVYPQVFSQCLLGLLAQTSLGGVPTNALYSAAFITPANEATTTRLEDPDGLAIRTPLLIEQGLADTVIPPALTSELAQGYAQHHLPVAFHTWPGVGHTDVLSSPAGADATAWIEAHLRP
jgi:pimeloyl-ACP methyl ester carboxylesterase